MKLTEFPLTYSTEASKSKLYRLTVGDVIPPSGKTLLVIGEAINPEANIGSIGYLDYYTKKSEQTFVIHNLGVEPPFINLIPHSPKLNQEIDNFVRKKGLSKILVENVKDDENPWLGTALTWCGYIITREGNAEKNLD